MQIYVERTAGGVEQLQGGEREPGCEMVVVV